MIKPVESADLPMSSDMFCLDCNYDLRGLRERRCPECGRAFDPEYPVTFWVRPRRRVTRLVILTGAASAYPVLYYLLSYPTWFAAWAELGRRPQVHRHDPAKIGGLVVSLYRIGQAMAPLLLPAAGFAVAVVMYCFTRWSPDTSAGVPGVNQARNCAFVLLAIWGGAMLLFAMDPLGVVAWYSQ